MKSFVKAKVRFFTYEDGGRPCVPVLNGYSPYLRVSNGMDIAARFYGMPASGKYNNYYDIEIQLFDADMEFLKGCEDHEFKIIEGNKIVGEGVFLAIF
jgi:hypothetical protein